MKKDDRIYLEHILDSFNRIQSYMDDVSYPDFLKDEEKQDAVIRKIEVAGEATKRLSMELRNNFPLIPWRAMAGMRDKLIHDYFDIDIDTIWETVTQDIPKLVPEISDVLDSLKSNDFS